MEIEFKNPTIYIIGGKAKHGKDTFSAYLKKVYENHGKKVIITQLAKYIKYYAREMTGWDLSEETKPREFLQQLGTGVIRQKLKKEIYDLKKVYPNIKVIHIVRPNFDNGLTPEQKMHPTEIDLDDFNDFDIDVVNTTLEELEKSAEKIYIENER